LLQSGIMIHSIFSPHRNMKTSNGQSVPPFCLVHPPGQNVREHAGFGAREKAVESMEWAQPSLIQCGLSKRRTEQAEYIKRFCESGCFVPASHFDFYGVGVLVESLDEELLRSVEHDFSYFLRPTAAPFLRIEFERMHPDYDSLPEMACSLVTPRNICFSNGRYTYIDYFGQALNIYDHRANHSRILTEDVELAHEIAYLTILSRMTEALERKRLHRIHGLGIESGGKATIVLLPSGGGKSTLALALLRNNNPFRLISEDSPLIRPDGQLLPFPLRIGLNPHNVPPDIDPHFVRADKRIEFHSKMNIDIRHFGARISRQAAPANALLLGIRTTGRGSRIEPVGKTAMVRHVLMNSIIGIGLYQGLEFLMQKSMGESIKHLGLLLSRAYNNMVLLRRVRVYRFLIGRDQNRNYECLREFLLQQH